MYATQHSVSTCIIINPGGKLYTQLKFCTRIACQNVYIAEHNKTVQNNWCIYQRIHAWYDIIFYAKMSDK